MKYKKVGKSGLITSSMTLGTMIFGETSARSTSKADAEAIIKRFVDAGGNHIDTADVYAQGASEQIVGEAIRGIRDKLIVATKVNFPMGEAINQRGLSRDYIFKAVEASLKRLKTDYIDLYYMHCLDPLTPMEESLRAFDDLVRMGKVRYIGVSNFKAWQLMKALATSDKNCWSRFVTGQFQYSLVKRDIEYEFEDLLDNEGVGLTVWSPLGGGFLSGKYTKGEKPSDGRIATMTDENEESWARRSTNKNWKILQVVESLAKQKSASCSQIALAWLLAKDLVSSIILGVRTMEQLEDNLQASEIVLSTEEIEQLDDVSKLDELYPYRFIRDYSKRTL